MFLGFTVPISPHFAHRSRIMACSTGMSSP
jgi:hypothetical protein